MRPTTHSYVKMYIICTSYKLERAQDNIVARGFALSNTSSWRQLPLSLADRGANAFSVQLGLTAQLCPLQTFSQTLTIVIEVRKRCAQLMLCPPHTACTAQLRKARNPPYVLRVANLHLRKQHIVPSEQRCVSHHEAALAALIAADNESRARDCHNVCQLRSRISSLRHPSFPQWSLCYSP